MDRNIIKQKQAEEKLDISERVKDTILNAMGEVITYYENKNLEIRWANKAAGDSAGLPAKELIGRHCYEIWHQRRRPCDNCPVEKAFEQKKFQELEVKTPDSRVWNVRAFPVISSGRRVLGIVECVENITARKQAEKALRESEERFRQLATASFEGILVHDKGLFLRANDQFFKMFGHEHDELVGKQVITLTVAPESRNLVRQHISKGSTAVYEAVGLRKDGTKFPMEIHSMPIEFIGRKARIADVRDITERKKAEEELAKSRERLRNLSAHLQDVREKDKKQIAREIHDELGQALTAIKIELSLLEEGIPEKRKKLVTQIKSITELIDSTLDRVKQISRDLRPDLIDDLGLVSAIEWHASEFLKRTGVDYVLALPKEEIALDPDLSLSIFRVFQEAVTNVVRHAKATKIKISLKKTNSLLKLVVQDNGIGIEEKVLASPTSLGLIGMQERMHTWGGEVEINGVRGKGSTIRATVPLIAGESDAENSDRGRPPDSAGRT